MIEFEFERLQSVGLTQAMVNAALAIEISPEHGAAKLVRVTEVHRESLYVHDGREVQGARALPALYRQLAEQETALAVGDWVLGVGATPLWIHARVAPRNHLVRRDGSGKRHPVVSNVDTALLVMGLDGDFNARRMERFLALAHASDVMPVIVLTKADVCSDAAERVDVLRVRVGARVPIIALDGRDAMAARALLLYCACGQTLVLLGSSGAGKSTLTNSLMGVHVQSTGAAREHDSRGKHTTTARSLHVIPGGACIIDTPGVRTLQPDADEATITAGFEDIASLAAQCRFANCVHGDEPSCAVREGVDADRLKNFQKMMREAQRETMTPLDRQKQLAQWKARGRAGHARAKEKRQGLS